MQNMEEIYKQNSYLVYQYLFCLTGKEDMAEDLTGETFAIAVKKIYQFKGECKVSTWLCQIAKHLWYKELKKSKKVKKISLEDLSEDVIALETTEDMICKKEEKLEFFKNVQKLEGQAREVVYLKLIGNLSFIEIGEILGKTPNWARVTFYRAKQKIKEVGNFGKEDRM